MRSGYKNMRACMSVCPHALDYLPEKLKKIAGDMLPADTGIEIETRVYDLYNEGYLDVKDRLNDIFGKINLVSWGYESDEIKFRIPKGIEGMKSLFDLCTALKENFELNPKSGIHYHTGLKGDSFCDQYVKIRKLQDAHYFHEFAFEPILKSLNSWGYNGKYNPRRVRYEVKKGWVNIRSGYKTVEYRIGEMTFDYSLMLKRIIHCHRLTNQMLKISMSTMSE